MQKLSKKIFSPDKNKRRIELIKFKMKAYDEISEKFTKYNAETAKLFTAKMKLFMSGRSKLAKSTKHTHALLF